MENKSMVIKSVLCRLLLISNHLQDYSTNIMSISSHHIGQTKHGPDSI